jgi:Zn-dependent protease/CBS domain-containing protein
VAGVIFFLGLFACVVLHELGHALMARRYGVRTREIVLYPIGGVAKLEGIPSGTSELLIALSGPAVNLVLAAGLGAFLLVRMGVPGGEVPLAPRTFELSLSSILVFLLDANLVLFLFNLLPAFPMDGGRILRAVLSFVLPAERATAIAAAVGQAFALLFAVAGLFFGHPILLFIAVFVFFGAGQEAAFHQRRSWTRGRSVRDAMVTRFDRLAPQDPLVKAAQLLLRTSQQHFPVVDAWGRVTGVLSRRDVLASLASRGEEGAVLEAVRRDVPVVAPDTALDEVLVLFQRFPGLPVLVAEEEGLVGMVTSDSVGRLVDILRHLARGRRASGATEERPAQR